MQVTSQFVLHGTLPISPMQIQISPTAAVDGQELVRDGAADEKDECLARSREG